MLIVPVSRRPDWRNPPLVTLLLILDNALIFFGLQSGDNQRSANAYRYYAQSKLPGIELPRYVGYLEGSAKPEDAARAARMLQDRQLAPLLATMENDRRFKQRLRRSSMLDRFGFKPAAPTLAGLGAAGFDWLFNASRMTPGVGASGVISAAVEMSSGSTMRLSRPL